MGLGARGAKGTTPGLPGRSEIQGPQDGPRDPPCFFGSLWPSLALQELELRAAAGGLEDAGILAAEDDAIIDNEALENCSEAGAPPPVTMVGSAKRSKTEALAKKSADHKRMQEILGSKSAAHFGLMCSLWWKEARDNTQATEGHVLLPEVDPEAWYTQAFLTQGGIPEVPHATELVRVSRMAAMSARGSCSVQTVPVNAENSNAAKCQRGAPAMQAIIEKLIQSLPSAYGGLLITVPFSGVRDMSVAALSVRVATGFDVRVLEYEAREFFWKVGEERALEAACADFNAGRLKLKGAEPLPAFDPTGSSAPLLREAVEECRSKMKVLSATDDGLLQVPELTALPEEMNCNDVKNKLVSLRSFSKKFTSLARSAPGSVQQAEDWKVVANAELTDVVGRAPARGLVLAIVGAEAASAKYGAQMGFQNETEADVTVAPGDIVGCGHLEVRREANAAKVSMPFGFESRSCSGSNAMYASVQAGGFIKSTVASALETVMSTSPPELLVYGHDATVTSGKVTLTRTETVFACGEIPDDVDVDNAGAYAILDSKTGTKTSKSISFLPVYHFNPTCDASVPTYHLQPLNNSQLIRVFAKKAFTVPAGKTMFPKWA